MRRLDRFIQEWRMRKAAAEIASPARVVDVGAHQGEFFLQLGVRLETGFGIEPLLKYPLECDRYTVYPGWFPGTIPSTGGWDYLTLLAVLEHVPRSEQRKLAEKCFDILKPGGRVIVTVPSPFVDGILKVLRALRLIDGMSIDEHFGFDPGETESIFGSAGFKSLKHRRFQCGLNHLFVFEKPAFSSVIGL